MASGAGLVRGSRSTNIHEAHLHVRINASSTELTRVAAETNSLSGHTSTSTSTSAQAQPAQAQKLNLPREHTLLSPRQAGSGITA